MPRRKKSKTGKRTKLSNTTYATRRKGGQFKDIINIGRSLAADRRKKSKRKVKAGYGGIGDILP